jgi:hypothetical protein
MIKVFGNKQDGYILTIIGKHDKFKADVALTYEEILEIQKLLNKKFK